MTSETPWSDPARLRALSRKRVGRDLARRIAKKLREDNGKLGIWHVHRDYCGHGLIYTDGEYRLVIVRDGFAKEGEVLLAWQIDEDFVAWLEKQSDWSLSGADRSAGVLFTDDPWLLNNQRLTRERLLEYRHGGPALSAFHDYLEGMDRAFRFLIDDFGFRRTQPKMFSRECVIKYLRRPDASISITSELLTRPFVELSHREESAGEPYNRQSFERMMRRRGPDWTPPDWPRDSKPSGESTTVVEYADFFDAYAGQLKRHFPELLGEPADEDEQTPPIDAAEKSGRPLVRLGGFVIVVASLLAMFFELRFFIVSGTPEASNSVRNNWGMLVLMSLPWITLVIGLLQIVLGEGPRRLSEAFSARSLWRRLVLGASAVVAAVALTLMVASFT